MTPPSMYRSREPLNWQRIGAVALSIAAHIALLACVMACLPAGEKPAFSYADEALPIEFILPINPVSPSPLHNDSSKRNAAMTSSISEPARKVRSVLPATIWKDVATPARQFSAMSVVSSDAHKPMLAAASGPASGTTAAGNGDNRGSQGSGNGDGSIELLSLRAKYSPSPDYPAVSSHNAEQGIVILLVRVGADGIPVEASVVKSSGFPRLDETTKKNILARWQFYPAMRAGVPIPAYVLAKQVFVMEGRVN